VDGVAFGLTIPTVELLHAFAVTGSVPADDDRVKADWEELVRKGAAVFEVLINEITAPVPGFAKVAVTLGFGAVMYE
jgi:hypothetical protein